MGKEEKKLLEEGKGYLRFNNKKRLERGTVSVDPESKLCGEKKKLSKMGMPSVSVSVSGSKKILNSPLRGGGVKKKSLKEGSSAKLKN